MQEENIYRNDSIKNVAPLAIVAGDGKPPFNPDMNKERKRTKFGILKLAARIFHPRSKTEQKQLKAIRAKPAQWEKIVGSMRPLHLQENLQSPTPSVTTGESPSRDFISTPGTGSPSPSFFSRKSGTGTMSQYNSAVNLQELDQSMSQHGSHQNLQDLDTPRSQYGSATNLQELDTPTSQYGSVNNLQELVEDEEEDKDVDEVFERLTGDDMIDLKAEEFIAMFYQEMRIERSKREQTRQQNYGGRRWVL